MFDKNEEPIETRLGETVKYVLPTVCLLMAAFAIFCGVRGSEFRLGGLGRTPTSRPLPTWLGRVWFFGFALIMLFLGIRDLYWKR